MAYIRLTNGGVYSSDFDYSDDPAFLSWMSISDQGVFSVNAAIATLPPTVRLNLYSYQHTWVTSQ